ncbi:hypothetical protein VTI74DRAFT_8372 [Chaetomium olivicolor]
MFRQFSGHTDKGNLNRRVFRECSILICGLNLPDTISPLTWERGPVPNPKVKKAVLRLPDGRVSFFRYFAPAGDEYPAAAPPSQLHGALDLLRAESGFLFVHNARYPDIEESMGCMRSHIDLLLQYGGRGFWVVINTPKDADTSQFDKLAVQFEDELNKYPQNFVRRVLVMPVEDSYQVAADAMPTLPVFPREFWYKTAIPEQKANREFLTAFVRGEVTPWKHSDYLRAAYLTLLDPHNKDLGLLEVASKFAANVNSLKQKNSRIQLMPESRTLTVFWLYRLKLGIHAMGIYQGCYPYLSHFERVFHYLPELMNEKLPESYYSPDILRTEYAEKFWMLPDLRELFEPHRYRDSDFRRGFLKMPYTPQEYPDRLLRFSLAVVQRYLRPGETRRRSWFINLAFAALQQQTMRLRTMQPSVSQYSETQAYFYLQMVHAALSQFLAAGKAQEVQEMSYPLFKETFLISPTAWKAHYTPLLWDSIKARGSFVPPDLMPLPDTINMPKYHPDPKELLADANERFRKAGLIPELPSVEVLHFHQAVLLEEAKSIKLSLNPSEVTTHAHLLRYIHMHIILPSRTLSPDAIFSLARQHLNQLITSCPLPRGQLAFYINLALHNLNLHPNPDYFTHIPTIPFNPSYTNHKTGTFVRFHNCPCHYEQPLPYSIGPSAVSYPLDAPYDHPPQIHHSCLCHKDVELDHDTFAALCSEGWRKLEDGEKQRKGMMASKWSKAGDEWEDWIRGEGGLVLCWEGAWRSVGKGVLGDLLENSKCVADGKGEETEGGEGQGGNGVGEKKLDEKGLDGDGDDEKTLAGGDGTDSSDEDEQWEVLSQDTLR